MFLLQDVLNSNLQTNLREKLGGGDPKGFSIGYASANSSVFDSAINMSKCLVQTNQHLYQGKVLVQVFLLSNLSICWSTNFY